MTDNQMRDAVMRWRAAKERWEQLHTSSAGSTDATLRAAHAFDDATAKLYDLSRELTESDLAAMKHLPYEQSVSVVDRDDLPMPVGLVRVEDAESDLVCYASPHMADAVVTALNADVPGYWP